MSIETVGDFDAYMSNIGGENWVDASPIQEKWSAEVILDRQSFLNLIKRYKDEAYTIIGTGGTFAVVHDGHRWYVKTTYQNAIKEFWDKVLFVLISNNKASSYRSSPGKSFPTGYQDDLVRSSYLAEQFGPMGVDIVSGFDDPTPEDILRAIREHCCEKIDIWVKWSDRGLEEVMQKEGKEAEQVWMVPLEGQRSSSAVKLQTLISVYKNNPSEIDPIAFSSCDLDTLSATDTQKYLEYAQEMKIESTSGDVLDILKDFQKVINIWVAKLK